MSRKLRRRRTAAFSLIELTVVISVLGILIASTFYGIGGILNMQNGSGVAQDLREICLVQKKSILRGLYNPPSLSGYGSPACPWLQPAYLADSSKHFSLNTTVFTLPYTSYNTLTIPPTCPEQDGNHGDVLKVVGTARSGDGLYDIGNEN